MSIFESLENLSVSEACFDDIMSIVEEIINELEIDVVDRALDKRAEKHGKKMEEIQDKYNTQDFNKVNAEEGKEIDDYGKKLDLYQKWVDWKKKQDK